MTTQDCLTYLMEAIAILFTALTLLDFLSGLPALLTLAPRATPNPVDITPMFDAVEPTEQEICQPLVAKITIAAIEDIPANPSAAPYSAHKADLGSLTRDRLAEIAKTHGIQHYRKGENRRKSKPELLLELLAIIN